MSRASALKVSGSGGAGRWSKSLRRRFVLVGLAVPVAAETQHADVHLSAAADDRHVRGDGAVDEGAAFVDQRPLIGKVKVTVQMHGARGNFHAFTLTSAHGGTATQA